MNWLYKRAERHADEAMLDFASMKLADDLRALIRAKITLAYTTAGKDAWLEASAAVRAVVAKASVFQTEVELNEDEMRGPRLSL